MCRARAFYYWCAPILVCAGGFAADGPPRICPKSPDAYTGYLVKQIRIETPLSVKTPLSFLFGVQAQLEEEFRDAKQHFPLKEGSGFDRVAYGASLGVLNDKYSNAILRPGERLRLTYIVPSLMNCDDTSKTVEVVYSIYSSDFLYYLSRIIESPSDKITRSLVPQRTGNQTQAAKTNNKILPQPFLGYNGSRGVFGGTKASFQTAAGMFKRMDLDASGSGNSVTAGMNLSGSKGFNRGWLSYVNWRLAYRYQDLPSHTGALKAGTGLTQFFGASQPVGDMNLAFRFGGSLEGGNRQTSPVEGLDPSSALTRAPYRAAKLYAGLTFNHGRQAWAASYGLQLGNSTNGFDVDYVKHIVDTRYDARFMWREHKPLKVEVQFTAGSIPSRDNLAPVVERFFGGNAQQDFIEGADWTIHSAPFIRSFPQNRLSRGEGNLPIGGQNFFSLNLTLAQPVWNRPAVPSEISDDAVVRNAIGAQLQSARTATLGTYIVEEPEYRVLQEGLQSKVNQLGTALDRLPERLEEVRGLRLPQEVVDKLDQISDDPVLQADLLSEMGDRIEQARSENDFRVGIRALITGFSANLPGLVTRLIADLNELEEALRKAGLNAGATEIRESRAAFEQLQTEMHPVAERMLTFGEISIADLSPALAFLKNGGSSDDVDRILQRMKHTIASIKLTTEDSDSLGNLIAPLETAVAQGEAAAKSAADADASPGGARDSIDELMVGFGELVPSIVSRIAGEANRIEQPLLAAGFPVPAAKFVRDADRLVDLQSEVLKRLKAIRLSKPAVKARRDIDFTARSLEVVFREMNLIAISPALMFDIARIAPRSNENQGGLRFGLGPGIRFSLVTFDVTAGYSWNLDVRPGEGRGAFVFGMDISDLFR